MFIDLLSTTTNVVFEFYDIFQLANFDDRSPALSINLENDVQAQLGEICLRVILLSGDERN